MSQLRGKVDVNIVGVNGAGEGIRTPAGAKPTGYLAVFLACPFVLRSRGQRDNHSATPAPKIDLVFWLKEFSVAPTVYSPAIVWNFMLPAYLEPIRNSLQKPIGVG